MHGAACEPSGQFTVCSLYPLPVLDIRCRSNLTAEAQAVPGKFLTQVLGQSEHVRELLEQSAAELSSANTGIRHELANSDRLPGMESALDKNEAVTRKLQDAFEKLTAVNQALHIEIRDRTMVDHQLAAAVEQEEGARHAALHDNLTGLPNRALFKDRLEHGIAQAKRHRWILAVMFVDLDNFKSINDTYGHQAGDAVLQTVAKRLAHNTRNEDTVSRYGGDEFLYLLTPLHEQKDIAMIAAKILKAIQAPCDVRVRDVIVNPCLDASIGISVFPMDGASAAALIKRADQAMYEAKKNKSGFAFAH
jgi:diguanylate cyclase (GGDEF)-like protein